MSEGSHRVRTDDGVADDQLLKRSAAGDWTDRMRAVGGTRTPVRFLVNVVNSEAWVRDRSA